jgi:hypothetical protein
MVRNRGSWYMLIVAFLFAISINFDKIAMLNSDPFFGMALTVMSIGIAFLLLSAYSHLVQQETVYGFVSAYHNTGRPARAANPGIPIRTIRRAFTSHRPVRCY